MEKEDVHAIIRSAAKDSQVLRITYQDKNNKIQARNVEPYEIRDGNLWAYCRKRKSIRQFKIDNIQKAKPTSYTYFPKWPVKINEENLEKKASFNNPWLYKIADSVFGAYHDAEIE